MSRSHSIDPITFEVLRHRLWEINSEMATIAARLSGAPAVYESGDFNTGLLNARGQGLFTGLYVIRQTGSIDVMVQTVRKRFEGNIADGDMFMTNDPWCGALHAMDYAVIAPVFYRDEIIAWTAVTMHEVDVGGPRPGSFTTGARNAFEECMLMPPVKIVAAGEFRHDIETIYLRNTRMPEINALNTRAKIAAQVKTRERLLEIVDQYGKDTFLALQEQILDHARQTIRARLARLPDGTWYGNRFLDHDGVKDDLYRFKVKLTKTGERLVIDFTGTSKQAAGAVNCTYGGLLGGLVQTLFPLLCFDIPWSHGAVADCVEVIAEEGSIVNATYPAATSMATINACQAIGDAVWEALARMYSCSEELREEVMGLSYGGVSMGVMSGTRDDGRPFLALFTDAAGGGGARSFADGIDTGSGTFAPNFAMPNVERTEGLYPLLYVYRKQRVETGGAGTWRGGLGIEFMVRPHGISRDIGIVYFGSGAGQMDNKGAAGGMPASVQRNIILRAAGVAEKFRQGIIPRNAEEAGYGEMLLAEVKDTQLIHPEDAWICLCNGGGGYGDPLLRAPERVAQDVARGLGTHREATELYCVMLDAEGRVDDQATAQSRAARRSWRLRNGRRLGPDWNPELRFEGRQLFRYGEALALRLTAAGAVIGCTYCGRVLCPATEDPRQRALLIEERPSALSPINRMAKDDQFVVREYCCPSCAIAFSVDMRLRDDDPSSPEMHLDAAQFEGLAK